MYTYVELFTSLYSCLSVSIIILPGSAPAPLIIKTLPLIIESTILHVMQDSAQCCTPSIRPRARR